MRHEPRQLMIRKAETGHLCSGQLCGKVPVASVETRGGGKRSNHRHVCEHHLERAIAYAKKRHGKDSVYDIRGAEAVQ